MRINFRQGIVGHQVSGFLHKNPSGHIDILASTRPVTVTVAHENTNYTYSEDNTVTNAWVGPFLPSENYWLYWDFNQLTFERTFGYTTLEPVAQSAKPGNGDAPITSVIAGGPGVGAFIVPEFYVLQTGRKFAVIDSTGNNGNYTVNSTSFNQYTGETTIVVEETVPSGVADGEATLDIDHYGEPLRQVGRHWYDTANNRHYVWQGTMWSEVIRVFAAQVKSGNTFIPQTITRGSFIGTQIGNTASVRAGRVLFDEASDPIRRDNKTFFTTEDQFFANASRVDAIRLESNVARAQYVGIGASVSAFSIVAWKNTGKVELAQYNDVGTTVVGLLTENVAQNEVGSIVIQGVVSNPDWNWTGGVDAVPVGTPLWIDNGQLTPYDPHVYDVLTYPIGRVPCARVLDSNTVVFEQGLGGRGEPGPPGSIEDIPAATTSSIGGVTLTVPSSVPDLAIVPSDLDPRLSDARTPLPHLHEATDVSFTPGAGIISNNVSGALLELGNGKLNKSGGTMTGFLTLNADPTINLHAATKQYVDGLVSGLNWKDPIHHVNLISDDLSAPPGTPNDSDVYIVAIGGTGDWAGLDGHMVQWREETTEWFDLGLLSTHTAGVRFGITMETPTTAGGSFAGLDTQIATLVDPLGPVWSFYDPSENDAVYVNNPESLHAYHQYVFDGTKWIEFGGNFEALAPDNLTIIQTGNILSVKPASAGGTVDAATLEGYDFAGLEAYYDTQYSAIGHTHTGTAITITPYTTSPNWGTPAVAAALNATNVQAALNELMDKKASKTPLYIDLTDLPNANNVHGMIVHVHNEGRLYFAHAGSWEPVPLASDTFNLPYDMAFFVAGNMIQDTTVGSFGITRDVFVDVGAPGSVARADVAATLPYSIEIVHRVAPTYTPTIIGTVDFAAGALEGTLTFTSAITFAPGDLLQLHTDAVTPIDATLRDVTLTIVGCSASTPCTLGP